MATNNITQTSEERNMESREDTRAPGRYLKPAVNIVEFEEGLALMADIPGATKESLDVRMEKGILTINAPVSRPLPGRPIYTEFELAPYYRQFQLPENIDQEKTSANLANGVLTLRMPKAEAAKPRRIEVQVAPS